MLSLHSYPPFQGLLAGISDMENESHSSDFHSSKANMISSLSPVHRVYG